MKRLIFTILILGSAALVKSQGFTDDFNAGSVGTEWIGSSIYTFSQTGGYLTVNINKKSPDQFFTLDWTGNIDLTANALLNVKIRGDKVFIIEATLYSGTGTSLSKEIRIGSESGAFVNYCFDFTAFAGKNQANKIEFAVNAPENSYDGKIYFEDLVIGTGAVKLAGLSPVGDIVVYKGKTGQKILVQDIANATAVSLSGAGALINNISATAISGGISYISFDCIGTGTAVATVTATAAATYINNTATFNITVEDDILPAINKPADASVPVGKETIIKLSGISDGNASAEQIVKVTAVSSNAAAIPNPVIEYDTIGSPYATLKVNPVSAGTATITITVKDNGTINNTTTTTFDITAYAGFNNAPTIKNPVKQTIFNKAPFTLNLLLSGISDGDGGSQVLSITATGKTGKVTPSAVTLVAGKDTATLKLTAAGLGKDTITVTVTDDGDNGTNNGDQSTIVTIPVEVLAPAPTGYRIDLIDFTADTTAKLWHIEQLDVSQYIKYVDTLGKRCMRINMKQKWDYAGLWYDLYRIPLELDVTNAPYMSYEIMSTNITPLVTLGYFWDSDSIRNLNGGKLETDTNATLSTFKEVFLDFRKPDYLNGPSGVPINSSRIITVLLNNHKNEFKWPNTLIDGTVYISNIRIGDSCKNVPPITPVCTINNMPTQIQWAGINTYNITISGISNGLGNTTGVIITPLSSKTPFMANPTLGTLGSDGKVVVTYNILNTNSDSAQIILRVNCTGSIQKEVRFWVKTVSNTASIASVVTIDAATKGQTITGFGAMEVPDALFDQYVKDQGCTMMRITFEGDVETTNDNYDAKTLDRSRFNVQALNIDYLRGAAAAGVTDFFVTLWSPPGWMKQNCSAVGGDYASYNWATNKNKVDPIFYDEYVEYMVSIVRLVKEETGVEIAGFCPQNEPGFVEPYGSAVLDPQHMAQVCGMLGKRLSDEGFKTKVIISEQVFSQGTWPVVQYANAVKSDSLANLYNKVVAMHYPDDNAAQWAAQWAACKSANQEYWATECTSEGNEYGNIIFQCRAMIQGFNYGLGAWIIWGYNGGSTGNELDVTKKTGMTYMQGKAIHYHAFKNFAKYIKKGAVQLKATSANAVVKVAAFMHDGDTTMTIVLLNTDTKMPISVRLSGSAPSSGYDAYRTTFYERCEKVYPFSGNIIALPPSSITTLYIKTNINHAPSADQVADVNLAKNAGTAATINGIGCGDPAVQQMTVTATSSNTAVLPNPTVSYTSPANKATLILMPVTDATGETTITVIIKDDGGRANGGIDADTMTFKVSVGLAAIGNVSDKVSLYPNPADDQVTVTLPGDKESVLTINNAAGQAIMQKIVSAGQTEIRLNVADIESGIYFVNIKMGELAVTKKLVIK